jgi:hypothetical protein
MGIGGTIVSMQNYGTSSTPASILQQYSIFQTIDELEDTVGNTALALQQLKGLGTDGRIVHHRPSTCASAASVSGSQKVIAIA